MESIAVSIEKHVLVPTLTLLVFLVSPVVATAQDCDPDSLSEIVSVFEGRSIEKMIYCTVEIQSAYPVRQDSFDFLASLWKQEKKRYPKLSWDLIERDIVKVHIASAMTQGFKSQAVDIEPIPIHDYLLQAINNSDHNIVAQALLSIANFDDPSDVDAIVHVALKDGEGVYTSAVTALAMMCTKSASMGLDRILMEIGDANRISFLKERRQQFDDLKRKAGYCGH
jgi:hypothetical protein